MKHLYATAMLLLGCLFCRAQLYDAQWALGYNESVVDFRSSDSVHIYTIPTLEWFVNANASICDEEGNLLYYTNGINICQVNNVLPGGTGLCPNCTISDSVGGLRLPQMDLFIPKPGSTRYYYLFHCSTDTLGNSRPGNLYYSLIDRQANYGSGAVIRQVNILPGRILKGGGMTACKHANGRDYWLVVGASDQNLYYKFLITPYGVFSASPQNIGPALSGYYDVTDSHFSADGSKYVTGIYGNAPTVVMDFDRCSGEFSNPVSIFNYLSTQSNVPIYGEASAAFSPNNRFLYVSGNTTLRQYDLWADNIQDSVQLFTADSSTWYGIHFMQLAPNGKIYCSTWGGGLYALHVINHPDEKGDSAGFVYGGQPVLTDNSLNLPNLINYRLGPLIGSGCDTITTDINNVDAANNLVRVQPNPANKFLYVEVGYPAFQAGQQGSYEFDLLNASGQLIDKHETRQVDYFDTQNLPAGNYFLKVTDKTTGKEMGTKEVVVVH